jgi:hypothetical protein
VVVADAEVVLPLGDPVDVFEVAVQHVDLGVGQRATRGVSQDAQCE